VAAQAVAAVAPHAVAVAALAAEVGIGIAPAADIAVVGTAAEAGTAGIAPAAGIAAEADIDIDPVEQTGWLLKSKLSNQRLCSFLISFC